MLTAVLAHCIASSLIEKRTELPAKWFGPVTASFAVDFAGNPFDPAQNDVRVRFIGPKGEPIERLAYFDGHGSWKANLVTSSPGKYTAQLFRNGTKALEPPAEQVLEAESPLPYGFIQVDPYYKNRFRRDTGELYYPVGFDLGWHNGNDPSIPDQLAKMAKAGVGWTRIWACNWDGKNPWWPDKGTAAMPGQLWVPALDQWQTIVDSVDKQGIGLQLTLFHHGLFSSKVNPNWPDHPWNAKNGGFLPKATDFFTDQEAKRRAKMWLRYAVARFAASPNLMAWELFNEVEWVDSRYEGKWNEISAWHKEMADYIRSIDPYHHLITTSSEQDQPDLLAPLDFVQPHSYPTNLVAAIYGAKLPTDKPGFFGEFGPPDVNRPDPALAIRDGIYSSMLANQAATAMFWYWDTVEHKNLYSEFATARKVIDESEFASHGGARKLKVEVSTSGTADLSFAPGGGWQKAVRTNLNLPEDLSNGALAGIPGFFQGTAHRDMYPDPLTVNFHASKPGVITITPGNVAKSGAHLHIRVNGVEVADKNYPASEADHHGEPVTAPFPSGSVKIELTNDGADWVTLENISISNAGTQASVLALGETDWMLMRATVSSGAKAPVAATIRGISLLDGPYEVASFDLGSGAKKTFQIEVKDLKLSNFPISVRDQILIFKRTK